MKKFKILSMISVFVIFFIFSIFISPKVYASSNQYIDDEVIETLETEELIEIIVDNELWYINLFSTQEMGIDKFKINNEYYKELITRENINENLELIIFEESNLDRKNDFIFLQQIINEATNNGNILNVAGYYDDIYTPNGRVVEHAYYSINYIKSADIIRCHNQIIEEFPNLANQNEADANSAYNCHSYAWYEQEAELNNYWISYPISYYEDDSYEIVYDVRPGDILCYWSYGYNDMYGSWQCCDYITHSAIIITADITFDLNDPDTLENIDLISKWGDFGVYTHNGDECPYGKTKDISFQYVTAYRPKTNASYNLTNYSGQINETATISSSNDNTNNYEMYELNVNYFKYYELNVSANSNLDVRLYDEHMQLVEFDDLNESDSNVHFINSLTNGERYYLRVAYDNSSSIGTIYTTMTSRNTAFLSIGENNILINTYNGDNTYYYINHSGVGFYKFTLQATKADGSVLTFPNEAIFIKDHMDEAQIDKYDVMGYSKLAETDYGFNSMYAYLYTGGYFYIHINMQAADYSDLKLIIERAEVDTIDVSGRTDEEFTDMLFSTNESIDYAKGFVIDQIAKFKLNVTTSSTPINNITFILFKKNYNSVTATYYKTDIVADYLPYTPVELILDEGTYYIGYFGNTNGITITCTLERVLELSNITTQVLVLDPDVVNTYGTEVRHNNGEFGEITITEGFTRHIHFTNMAGVPSISRYDYSFYSSNQNYATVSEYGTVFAKAVSSNKTVTITAVYKADPSKIFIIEVIILNDTSGVQRTIETTQTISLSDFENGKYKLVLNETNSPYPWIQYFNWSVYVPCQEVDILVNMDYYGFLTTTGTGSATLTGEYTINPNVTIIIHIRFI